jgi:hypothetical protein
MFGIGNLYHYKMLEKYKQQELLKNAINCHLYNLSYPNNRFSIRLKKFITCAINKVQSLWRRLLSHEINSING